MSLGLVFPKVFAPISRERVMGVEMVGCVMGCLVWEEWCRLCTVGLAI